MHKFNIRRGLTLLLAAGICLVTLATTGAAGQSEGAVTPDSGLKAGQETPVRPAQAPASSVQEEEDTAQVEARQRRAAALLARQGVTGQQREVLCARMGAD